MISDIIPGQNTSVRHPDGQSEEPEEPEGEARFDHCIRQLRQRYSVCLEIDDNFEKSQAEHSFFKETIFNNIN